MRKIVIATVIVLSLAALYWFCVVPWQANVVSKTLEATVQQAIAGKAASLAFLGDEKNLAAAEAWRQRFPDDVNLNVAIASALALSGRGDDALRVYAEALRYDRRPEMYFNRAGIRLGMNDVAGALDDYVYATRFNAMLVDSIRTESIRSRVRSELERIRSGVR